LSLNCSLFEGVSRGIWGGKREREREKERKRERRGSGKGRRGWSRICGIVLFAL